MRKLLVSVVVSAAVVCLSFGARPALAGPADKSDYHKKDGYHGMKGDYDPKESFQEFSRKLNLTKQQQDKIRPILNEEVREIKEVYKDAWQKEKRIIERHRDRVMTQLNPQQKEKYRKMLADREMKREEMMKHHMMMDGKMKDGMMKDGMMKDGKMRHEKMKEGRAVGAQRGEAAQNGDIPVVVTVVVARPVDYYGKSVIAEGYVKKVLTKDAFILSEAPDGQAEIVVVGAGPAVVTDPRLGQKVAVRGVFQNFKIDNIEKALGVDLDEGIFGVLENRPGIFARWVRKL